MPKVATAPTPAPLEEETEAQQSVDVEDQLDALATLTVEDAAQPSSSPAKQMQDVLGREFAALDDVEPWPLSRTVAFVIFSCGAFWTAVYFGISALVG